jgi:HTH-type transcriptional regulator, competence development regulator
MQMNNLGNFIRSKREENNLLLRHLAAKLDVDVAYLSKLERGERTARSEHLPLLSEVFNVPISEIQMLWASDHITTFLAVFGDNKKAIQALDLTKQQLLQFS